MASPTAVTAPGIPRNVQTAYAARPSVASAPLYSAYTAMPSYQPLTHQMPLEQTGFGAPPPPPPPPPPSVTQSPLHNMSPTMSYHHHQQQQQQQHHQSQNQVGGLYGVMPSSTTANSPPGLHPAASAAAASAAYHLPNYSTYMQTQPPPPTTTSGSGESTGVHLTSQSSPISNNLIPGHIRSPPAAAGFQGSLTMPNGQPFQASPFGSYAKAAHMGPPPAAAAAAAAAGFAGMPKPEDMRMSSIAHLRNKAQEHAAATVTFTQ